MQGVFFVCDKRLGNYQPFPMFREGMKVFVEKINKAKIDAKPKKHLKLG